MQLSQLVEMDELQLTLVGDGDLSRRVRWVYTTDLLQPARYMSGGELVLTSLTWYRRPEDAWAFIESITHGGASGLVAGLAEVGQLPPALAEACARHHLALFTVSVTMSFNLLTETVGSALLEQRRQLAALARPAGLLGTSSLAMIDTLSATSGLACAWLSAAGNPRHRVGRPLSDAQRAAAWRAGRYGRGVPVVTGSGDQVLTVWPVTVAGSSGLPSFLVLPGHRRDWPLRTRSMVDLTVDRLAVADPPDGQAGISRDAGAAGTASSGTGEATLSVICASLGGTQAQLCRQILLEMPGGPWETSLGPDGTVTAVRRGTLPPQDLSPVGGRLDWYRAALGHDERLTLGICRGASPDALERAAVLHRWATRTSETVSVVTDDDVGERELLWRLLPPDALRAFADQLLDDVRRHDSEHGGELLSTLRAFVAHGGSWSRAAQELHIHVNSVRYRLRAAEQLAGRRLTRDSDRTDLRIAFEGMALHAANQ